MKISDILNENKNLNEVKEYDPEDIFWLFESFLEEIEDGNKKSIKDFNAEQADAGNVLETKTGKKNYKEFTNFYNKEYSKFMDDMKKSAKKYSKK